MQRYARQIILPQIGVQGQLRLAQSSVLCVGAGGLGSPALLYLASAGVGRLGIVDADRVEEENLHRQVLFDEKDVGAKKTHSAGKRLKAMNDKIKIELHDLYLDADNAVDVFANYDVILDATDNFATTYSINDAALTTGRPWVYGAIEGFEGRVGVFPAPGGGCYRCLYPEAPAASIRNCAQAGVLGPVVGMIGTVQALQAIQLLLGGDGFSLLQGKLWMIDATTMQTHLLACPRRKDCPACGGEKGQKTFFAPQSSAIGRPNAQEDQEDTVCIPMHELVQGKDMLLLDIREPEEKDAGTIEGALAFPFAKLLAGQLPQQMQSQAVVVICKEGFRSLDAVQIMKARGCKKIYSLSGGYRAWRAYMDKKALSGEKTDAQTQGNKQQ